MNIKYIKNSVWKVALLLNLLVFAGCSQDETVVQNYLRLSDHTFTFESNGDEVLTIGVEANPKWEVEYDADWIVELERSANSIRLQAVENLSADIRTAEITFKAADMKETAVVSQLTNNDPISSYILLKEFVNSAISSNGLYIGAVLSELRPDESYLYTIFRINTKTKERVAMGQYTEDIAITSISDNGHVVFTDYSNAFYLDLSGKRHRLEIIPGYTTPLVRGCSTDGSVIYGSMLHADTWDFVPVIWKNGGSPITLPLPEKNLAGDDDLFGGAKAWGCSADGSIIWGAVDDGDALIYWKDGEVFYAGLDIFDRVMIDSPWGFTIEIDQYLSKPESAYCMTPDGRYLAAQLTTAVDRKEKNLPAYFDLQTGKTTVIDEIPGGAPDGGTALGVSETGFVFYASYEVFQEWPLIRSFDKCFAYDMNSKTSMTTSEYLKKEYGIALIKEKACVLQLSSGRDVLYGLTLEPGVSGLIQQDWYIVLN